MRDAATRSEWLHYTGECILGPQQGRRLPTLPAALLPWRAFQALYPTGSVVPPVNSWGRRALGRLMTRPPVFALPGVFRRTLRAPDRRLPEAEIGLGVVVGHRALLRGRQATAARFYPLRALRTGGVINDRLGGLAIAVIYDATLGAAVAFDTTVDGQALKLRRAGPGLVRDAEGGTEFDLGGRGQAGPLAGRRLALAPGLTTRWYGFVATYPEATVWEAPG